MARLSERVRKPGRLCSSSAPPRLRVRLSDPPDLLFMKILMLRSLGLAEARRKTTKEGFRGRPENGFGFFVSFRSSRLNSGPTYRGLLIAPQRRGAAEEKLGNCICAIFDLTDSSTCSIEHPFGSADPTLWVVPSSQSFRTTTFLGKCSLTAQHQLGRKRLLDTLLATSFQRAGIKRLISDNHKDFSVFGSFERVPFDSTPRT